MKGCLVRLGVMLADAAPWYLPVLALTLLAWLGAGSLEPRLRARPRLHGLYLGLPVLMLSGLVVHRAAALFSLHAGHTEVALYLGSSASSMEKLRLLFTGHGGVEGAMVALVVFALASPALPSLRKASESTKRFVRNGLMAHNAAWVLLGMLLLLPADAHAAGTSLPSNPILPVPSWSVFAGIVLFTLLVMMAGELLVGTSRMAANQDTKTLVQRALLKTWIAGTLAWMAVFQSDVFSTLWWPRPAHDPRSHAALLVVSYATLVSMFHAPLVEVEHRFSHHPRQSRTLAGGLLLAAIVVFLVTLQTLSFVPLYGDGMVAVLTAWRLVATMFLACGLLMMFPLVGYDAAQRPEAWWFRIGWLVLIAGGPLLSATTWLLVPGLFMAAAALVLFPLFVEAPTRPVAASRVGFLVVLGVLVALWAVVFTARGVLLSSLLSLLVANLALRALLSRWTASSGVETSA